MKTRAMLAGLAVILALGAAFSLVHLFQLRYQAGDVYPAYSSWRTDPRGAKALFESLQRVSGLQVRRNLGPSMRLTDGGRITLFCLGLDARLPSRLHQDDVKAWEGLVMRGSRLVLSLSPASSRPAASRTGGGRKGMRPGQQQPTAQDNDPEQETDSESSPDHRDAERTDRRTIAEPGPGQEFMTVLSVLDRWGVALDYLDLPRNEEGDVTPARAVRTGDEALPSSITWYSGLFFRPQDEAWEVIYTRDEHALLLQRRLGSGSIVLSADSYFLSNQALLQDRYPRLLAWLVGAGSEVVFDETHLGVREQPGVAALARRYGLGGMLLGLVVMAGLFVWKNSSSLVPRRSAMAGKRELLGRDSAAGFANLLRRTIPPSEVIFTCFDQWNAAYRREGSVSASKLQRMEAVIAQERARPPRERNPVAAYRALSRILET